MLCGRPPYAGKNDSAIQAKILEGAPPDFTAKSWARVSPEAKDLITKLLTYKFKNRITAKAAIQHPWIANRESEITEETMEHVIANISSFNAQTKLKNAIHTFVAT
jgi:serine/threonine protein kinase